MECATGTDDIVFGRDIAGSGCFKVLGWSMFGTCFLCFFLHSSPFVPIS